MNGRYERGSRNQGPQEVSTFPTLDPSVILECDSPQKTLEMVKLADKVGKGHVGKDNVTSTQLRKIYDLIRKASQGDGLSRDLVLVLPQLAYAGGKDRKLERFTKELAKLVETVIRSNDTEKARHLVEFLEAVIAYSKQGGGR